VRNWSLTLSPDQLRAASASAQELKASHDAGPGTAAHALFHPLTARRRCSAHCSHVTPTHGKDSETAAFYRYSLVSAGCK